MTEVRSIWLVTESDAPSYCSYGNVRDPSSEANSSLKDWAAALSVSQEADVNFTATTTAWRRGPAFSTPGIVDHANAAASLVSRTLRIGGVTWDLDDAGRTIAGQENHAPDGILVDMIESVVLAEGVGEDLTFVEDTTLKLILVMTASQEDDIVCPVGYGSALYRRTSDSVVIRIDAV